MKIFSIPFNHFLVNTYILQSENNDALLIDPACSNTEEEEILASLIKEKKSIIKYIIFTHTHIDHIAGAEFAKKTYPNAVMMMHKDALPLYQHADNFCLVMGFEKQNLPEVNQFIDENYTINIGGETLSIFHTPGHANGSICLYNQKDGFVITGDVLFQQSIGRTDLPGGNYKNLIDNIKNKLLTLPPETKVFPGHGDVTSIAFEKKNNPFLQQ